ncbi:MAG: YbhB/YbcL family Raf kinase inhibitor-like protein [Phycisphaerae bacterium]|nr:YbhB/YbcL family Raf kinase inhibitor-like protein [Phycisphaerae bacterium]
MNKWMCLMVAMVTLSACKPQDDQQKGESKMDLTVTSTAFEDGQMIPSKYTADGQDISPPLAWQGAPDGTKSIALINDDPDAPMGTWVHWLVWNIPPDATGLDEDTPPDAELADGSRQGTADFGRTGYGGPAPPSGVHRYFFKVYALDTMLDLPAGATKPQLEKAMAGHILAQGQLMGRYTREK